MHRLTLAAAAALALLVASPALASHEEPPISSDERHLCVITNSDRNEGYCIKTYGIELPRRP